jgi:hypothetical protein
LDTANIVRDCAPIWRKSVRDGGLNTDGSSKPGVVAADGVHIGIREHASPFGRIRFSAQTISAPDGNTYTVLVGEGSQVVTSTIGRVIIALAIAAPIVMAVSACATYMLVARSMRSFDAIRSRVADISASDLAGSSTSCCCWLAGSR